MGKNEDLTGQRFGRLTVIGLNEEVSKQKKKTYWNCKCNCGNEKVVRGDSLRGGATTSCGCYQKEKSGEKIDNLIGQRFGRLTVISYNEEVSSQKKGTNSYWNCKCDCGNEKVVRGTLLKSGNTISCGCYHREKAKEKWKDEEFRHMQSKIRSGMVGENHPHWKGGITSISTHLGNLPIVRQWFDNSKKQVNYTCELTGKVGGVNTHHLKAFSTIVKEAHELNSIQVKQQVKDYTEEELHKLEEYVASWHKDTSNAVVLNEDIHNLFHRSKKQGGYGQYNNTPEQYEEFKQRYLNGEFKGLI